MIAKKKGRRPKSYYENLKLLDLSNNVTIIGQTIAQGETAQGEESTHSVTAAQGVTLAQGVTVLLDSSNNVVHKKRGRKPKGGKLIEEKKEVIEVIQKPNIILHLNCKLNEITSNELKYNPNIDNIIEFDNNYNIFNTTNSDNLNANNEDALDVQPAQNDLNALSANALSANSQNANPFLYEKKLLNDNIADNKNIYKKLQDLSKQLKSNNITKKCACFWCTYDFDNDPIMIPKYELKGTYHCYGNFCSPECAASFLMNENVDSSKKFERYYLLNNVYCKIYNYEKNIKCAPSPFYMLEKYYGNLNIQEYRKLLKNERLLLLVDKPLAKLLPELYDENEDYILNNKHINKKAYKINVK
jgi:predicted Zn-ribbon and HTH transcriptional regulator